MAPLRFALLSIVTVAGAAPVAAASSPASPQNKWPSWNSIAQTTAGPSGAGSTSVSGVTSPKGAPVPPSDGSPSVARAKYLWSQSPHGRMLERILPPAIEPRELPEPNSEGARLTARYCVQCHYLPSPRMHSADKWTAIVVRMVWRMQGKGNLGVVMKEMMDNVEAPADPEIAALTRYLQRHGQKEMNPAHPALRSNAGQIYSIACTQCHALPDPRRHAARDWPGVVERMKRHMVWANTVAGPDGLKTTPVLDTGEIVRFLQRHARAEPKPK